MQGISFFIRVISQLSFVRNVDKLDKDNLYNVKLDSGNSYDIFIVGEDEVDELNECSHEDKRESWNLYTISDHDMGNIIEFLGEKKIDYIISLSEYNEFTDEAHWAANMLDISLITAIEFLDFLKKNGKD